LTLPAAIHAEIAAHALAGVPHEACGLFAAKSGSAVVERFYPIANAAASREIYELDPAGFMHAERDADERGLEIVGVMHSHTHTTCYPSPTDVADAANFDPFGAWHFLIVSLKHPQPAMRSFRILDGEITEEPVVVA